MDVRELAWASGLFDGEGCISISPNRYTAMLYPNVTMAMQDEDSVRRFHRAVGVGGISTRPPHGTNISELFVWSANSFQAKSVFGRAVVVRIISAPQGPGGRGIWGRASVAGEPEELSPGEGVRRRWLLYEASCETTLQQALPARPSGGMSIRFLVPRRSDGGHRDRLWNFCKEWWGPPIIEGASPDGPFNRAAAINDAARGDWDTAVILDADVVAPREQVNQAIDRASETGRVCLAFERFAGLNQHMTERVLEGYTGNWDKGVRYRSDVHESSIVVVPRAVWDTVGGFDERFVGWGQEDVAFIQSARVLTGWIDRVPGTVWHLWHARAPERMPTLPGYQANQDLGRRYRRTRTPEAMRALLNEGGVRASSDV